LILMTSVWVLFLGQNKH